MDDVNKVLIELSVSKRRWIAAFATHPLSIGAATKVCMASESAWPTVIGLILSRIKEVCARPATVASRNAVGRYGREACADVLDRFHMSDGKEAANRSKHIHECRGEVPPPLYPTPHLKAI